ncbi:hypothetical protein PVAP13_5KG349707 [Panicum virgatum]|uniref:Uncharacterized protein n=1 Tax=Panicum virgatum TaxID=38727 RepID=A0A8T0SIM7_PANVG|nr:hypothetical protein PVAP13_5KG349707 [Panicum virgatum]
MRPVRKAAGVLFPSSDASKRAWRGHLGLPRRLTGGSCPPRRWSLRGHRSGMAPTGSGGSALEVIDDAAEARSGCGSSHSGARLGAGARQRRPRGAAAGRARGFAHAAATVGRGQRLPRSDEAW